MYKTIHNVCSNSDGTITAVSTTTCPDGTVVSSSNKSTHYKDMFDLMYGKSRTTDVCEITVVLDGVKV